MFGVFLKTWLSKVWGNSAIPISNQKFFLCKPQPDPGGAEPKGQKGGTELPGTRGHGQQLPWVHSLLASPRSHAQQEAFLGFC